MDKDSKQTRIGASLGGVVNAACTLNFGVGKKGFGRAITNIFWHDKPMGMLDHWKYYATTFAGEVIAEAGLFSYLVYQGAVNDRSYLLLAGADLLNKVRAISKSSVD